MFELFAGAAGVMERKTGGKEEYHLSYVWALCLLVLAFSLAAYGPVRTVLATSAGAAAVLIVGTLARTVVGKVKRSIGAAVAVVLCAVMVMTTAGCTPSEQKAIKAAVGQIGADIPKAMPLINGATAVADALVPGDALLITSVSSTVQAGLVELAALCNSYAASPSDTVWQSIVFTVNRLVDQGASGLLDAAKITNPASRALATGALGAIQTMLLLIDGIVQQTQTKAQVQAHAALRPVKLRQIEPYLDRQMVERETGHGFGQVVGYETSLGF